MKFRKRPTIIEARRATERETIHTTLEGDIKGDMVVEPGYYIITSENGEQQVCEPAVFHALYEIDWPSVQIEIDDAMLEQKS